MWRKVILVSSGFAAVFLAQQFLAGLGLPVNIFLMIILALSLKRHQASWLLALAAGTILDLVFNLPGFYLSSFFILVALLFVLNDFFSPDHFLARFGLIIGSVAWHLGWLYLLGQLAGWLGFVFYYQTFSFNSWLWLSGYLILNSLGGLLVCKLLNQLRSENHAAFS